MAPARNGAFIALGGTLAFVGLIHVAGLMGLSSNLRPILGWGVLALFGLFLAGFGLIPFLSADEGQPVRANQSQSLPRGVDTRPSSGVRTSHRGR